MAKTTSMICIVCPMGCHLDIDDNLEVTNNKCKRGEVYAKKELLNPTRIITSTVKIKSEIQPRVSIKTSNPVPKERIMDVMEELCNIELVAPVHRGDVIIKNILNTDVDIVITMTLKQ